jgi:fluoride ion exporter CrcB/FEX
MKLRIVAALAVLVSVGIHLKLWFDGMKDIHVVGPAFLANVAGGLVIVVLLVRWKHWLPPVLAICFGASTLGAFTIASTVGLFGDHETWHGSYVLVAATVEVLAVVTGAAVVLEE